MSNQKPHLNIGMIGASKSERFSSRLFALMASGNYSAQVFSAEKLDAVKRVTESENFDERILERLADDNERMLAKKLYEIAKSCGVVVPVEHVVEQLIAERDQKQKIVICGAGYAGFPLSNSLRYSMSSMAVDNLLILEQQHQSKHVFKLSENPFEKLTFTDHDADRYRQEFDSLKRDGRAYLNDIPKTPVVKKVVPFKLNGQVIHRTKQRRAKNKQAAAARRRNRR